MLKNILFIRQQQALCREEVPLGNLQPSRACCQKFSCTAEIRFQCCHLETLHLSLITDQRPAHSAYTALCNLSLELSPFTHLFGPLECQSLVQIALAVHHIHHLEGVDVKLALRVVDDVHVIRGGLLGRRLAPAFFRLGLSTILLIPVVLPPLSHVSVNYNTSESLPLGVLLISQGQIFIHLFV